MDHRWLPLYRRERMRYNILRRTMIKYNHGDVFHLLLRIKGTALVGHGPRRALFMACFAAIITGANRLYQGLFTETKASLAFVDTLTVFNVFMGLLISFRLNSAFNQWRAGVVAIGSLGDAGRG